MYFRISILITLGLEVISIQAAAPYCLAGERCFPTDDSLSRFNDTINGALIQVVPYGAACYEASYDAEKCRELVNIKGNFDFRDALPAGVMYTNFELLDSGEGCPVPDAAPANEEPQRQSPLQTECTLGNQPSYVVNATSPYQVQSAVKFAAEYNLRLRVKNSGHCYSGRSSGAGSLSIWTRHMNDAHAVRKFVPEGCSVEEEGHDAISVGTGANVEEIYNFAAENNFVTIGGYVTTVGAAGGYILGGGMGPLAPHFGLGVDNALQYEIVTADGEIKIANECTNADLFWALRGGGGTFGVTTRLWLKAHPALAGLNTVVGSFTCEDREGYEAWIDSMIENQKPVRDLGHTGIWSAEGASLGGAIIDLTAFFDNSTIVPAEESLSHLKNIVAQPETTTCTSKLSTRQFLGDKAFINAYRNVLFPASEPGSSVGVNIQDFSRLVSGDMMSSQDDLDAMKQFILDLPEDQTFIWQNDNGGVATEIPGDATSINPAWRDAFAYVVIPNFGPWYGPTEEQNNRSKDLVANMTRTFGTAAYYNEHIGFEDDWQRVFWGTNYDRLLEVKRMVDPRGVFSCPLCVGSEGGY